MNLGDLKLYQEGEDRERARVRRQQEYYMEARKQRRIKYEDNFGISPQILINLTTNDLLKNPIGTVLEKLNKTQKVVEYFYTNINAKNDGVDIGRTIPFGKHQGKTVWEVINCEPQYALWLHNKTDFKLTDLENEIARYQYNDEPMNDNLID